MGRVVAAEKTAILSAHAEQSQQNQRRNAKRRGDAFALMLGILAALRWFGIAEAAAGEPAPAAG